MLYLPCRKRHIILYYVYHIIYISTNQLSRPQTYTKAVRCNRSLIVGTVTENDKRNCVTVVVSDHSQVFHALSQERAYWARPPAASRWTHTRWTARTGTVRKVELMPALCARMCKVGIKGRKPQCEDKWFTFIFFFSGKKYKRNKLKPLHFLCWLCPKNKCVCVRVPTCTRPSQKSTMQNSKKSAPTWQRGCQGSWVQQQNRNNIAINASQETRKIKKKSN